MNDAKKLLEEQGIYFGHENISGIECEVGYIKKFEWTWMATQLNTFIFIGHTDTKVTRQTIERFSAACLKYALANHKGWPRGLQAGVASIAILQGTDFDDAAVSFCRKLTKSHWSAFEIPVLYDTNMRQVIKFDKIPIWGNLYFPYLGKTLNSLTRQF